MKTGRRFILTTNKTVSSKVNNHPTDEGVIAGVNPGCFLEVPRLLLGIFMVAF